MRRASEAALIANSVVAQQRPRYAASRRSTRLVHCQRGGWVAERKAPCLDGDGPISAALLSPLWCRLPSIAVNLGSRSDLVMKDMHTNGIVYVTPWPGENMSAVAPVQAVQGLGHGVYSASLTAQSALAAPPPHGSSRTLLPRGYVKPSNSNSSYAFEFWFRRGSGSLQTTVSLNMLTTQYSSCNGGFAVMFLLPNCLRVYINGQVVRYPPYGDGVTPVFMRFRTQVCDAALPSFRWHQVVVSVTATASGRIWLNGNEGVGWNGTFPCQLDFPSLWPLPNGTELAYTEPGFFCSDVKMPKHMVSDPWPLSDNGFALGDAASDANFGSIAHVAVYDSHEPALQRIQADMGQLPALSGGSYVTMPTSTLSYYLGRPTIAVVCNDPLHVLEGGPVQRVWMGAWSGAAAVSVSCEEQPPSPFVFHWPWSPAEPSGADTHFWSYRAIVSVAINFSPLIYPPGSVAEDSLRIDIEEELSALMVHINPARIEANLVADVALNALDPPALRLRVTFTPQRDGSSSQPWGPTLFHTPSALNSAVAAAEQLQAMLETPDQSIFGDRLWQLLPEAPGGIAVETEAPCDNAEAGFAKACSADGTVLPGFVVAGAAVAVAILTALVAAAGEFDRCCPDVTGTLDSLRAADPGLGDDWRLQDGLDFPNSRDGGTAAGGTSLASRRGERLSASRGSTASSAPKPIDRATADAVWVPVGTDGSLVEALRAIRDGRWREARSSGRAILAASASGPALVAPGARAESPMTSQEVAVVVRAALQPPRAAMVVIPITTAAVVLTNVLVLVEYCLEQNGLGSIVAGLGLIGWFALNAVAACARHASLVRPLWERGEGGPVRPTAWLSPVCCCFCGPQGTSGLPGVCAQAAGIVCNLAFCWPCCRRVACCQWLCGNGGPVACARDTFGLGCACARSLVGEAAMSASLPVGHLTVSSDGRGQTPAAHSGSVGSFAQPEGIALGTGSTNGSASVPTASGLGKGPFAPSAAGFDQSWAGGSAVSAAARRRYEWTVATSMSGGVCGCVGAEMVRGLMRRNGDSGAELWQRYHPCWHATSTLASVVFGPVWLQLHMSRACPWGCCSQTWSIDAEYADAGADSLRRQTILGALVLGACNVSYGFASVISASELTVDTVPTQWTTHVNLGVTLAWLLYLVISALFSRFAAVDDDDARYAVLVAGSEFDSVIPSTGRGSVREPLRSEPPMSGYPATTSTHSSGSRSRQAASRRDNRAVVPGAGAGAIDLTRAASGRGPQPYGVETTHTDLDEPREGRPGMPGPLGPPHRSGGAGRAPRGGPAGAVEADAAASTTEEVGTFDRSGFDDVAAPRREILDPRGEIHAGGILREPGIRLQGEASDAWASTVVVPDGAYTRRPQGAMGLHAHGRAVLPPQPPDGAEAIPAEHSSAPPKAATALVDDRGAMR